MLKARFRNVTKDGKNRGTVKVFLATYQLILQHKMLTVQFMKIEFTTNNILICLTQNLFLEHFSLTLMLQSS